MESYNADILRQMGFAENLISDAMQLYSDSLDGAIAYILGYGDVDSNPNEYQDITLTQLDISQYSFGGQGSSSCTAIAFHFAHGLLKLTRLNQDIHDRGNSVRNLNQINP